MAMISRWLPDQRPGSAAEVLLSKLAASIKVPGFHRLNKKMVRRAILPGDLEISFVETHHKESLRLLGP